VTDTDPAPTARDKYDYHENEIPIEFEFDITIAGGEHGRLLAQLQANSATAQFCLRAGLSSLLPQHCGLPPVQRHLLSCGHFALIEVGHGQDRQPPAANRTVCHNDAKAARFRQPSSGRSSPTNS
jgi:hypothetical protein